MAGAAKTLLIGVDTSDSSKNALEWTLKNLANKGDTVHVVWLGILRVWRLRFIVGGRVGRVTSC